MKYGTIIITLALVAHDFELEQIDVKLTFLHREKKMIFYGLKQLSRRRYKIFDSFVTSVGLLKVYLITVCTLK